MSDDNRDIAFLAAVLALLIMAVALWGCTSLSREQAQTLAEARAGAQASQQLAAEPKPNWEKIARAYAGLAGFTIAATENLTLPAPAFLPAGIVQDPAPYADAGASAQQKPPEGWGAGTWTLIGTSTLAAVAFALQQGKNVPGVVGVASALAEGVWKAFAPKKLQQAEVAKDKALDLSICYASRLAEIAETAGFRHLVEDAKLKAALVGERLGARDLIINRLEAVRADPLLPPTPEAPLVGA